MPFIPKLWTKEDIPTRQEMTDHLALVRAVRDTFPELPNLPGLPASMDALTYETANNIEKILLQVSLVLNQIELSWFDAGELDAGGD